MKEKPSAIVPRMFLSLFDLLKIGIGPSSSHTMGPMCAAGRFLAALTEGQAPAMGAAAEVRIRCTLHGSLAFTGKGHGTDRAVALGLMGYTPETIEPDHVDQVMDVVRSERRVNSAAYGSFLFDPEEDLIFHFGEPLPGHSNGMAFTAVDGNGRELLARVYYSVGGGFVVEASELDLVEHDEDAGDSKRERGFPYPFGTADEMIRMAQESGLSLVEMKRANERVLRTDEEINEGIDAIWDAMSGCIERGLRQTGELPGGLRVQRRAKAIKDALVRESESDVQDPYAMNEWLSVYSMAVNEENAAGGRVVTAPTNGAAGVVPAVGRWYVDHHPNATREEARDFLLAAAAIGGLIKHNASISGAEVGCQGEVGSASAMAAAGLTAVRGGSVQQIEHAAEIALEHHLGMTCDPVGGLVQVPCIERNGFGAVKAVTASSLALRGDGEHSVTLDRCVETMRQTGIDLSDKYKETSKGGLAVTHPAC